jgi:hypothetical protein
MRDLGRGWRHFFVAGLLDEAQRLADDHSQIV